MQKNLPYDVQIHCLWCHAEWTICKNEIWFKPNVCPLCKKDMGEPAITHGARRNDQTNQMDEFHEARSYSFEVSIPKSKFNAFVDLLNQVEGSIHGLYVRHSPWSCNIEIDKHPDFFLPFGIKNPPRWEAQ